MMASSGWAREFEDPIALPGGRELHTLLDAGDYIQASVANEIHNELHG
jgi:hypothetical protein